MSPLLSHKSHQTELWFSGLGASTFVCWVISAALFCAQLTNPHTHTPSWQMQITEPAEKMDKVKEIAVLSGYPDDKTSFTLGWTSILWFYYVVLFIFTSDPPCAIFLSLLLWTDYLGWLLLKKLDFSILEKGKKSRDDMFQECRILRRRRDVLGGSEKGKA